MSSSTPRLRALVLSMLLAGAAGTTAVHAQSPIPAPGLKANGTITYDANGVPIPTSQGGGLIVPGVMVVAGDTVPNTIRTAAQSYHRSLSGIAEAFAYDASFVKLREVRLGIEVPRSFTDRLGVAQMSLALIGRNLLLWADIPNIDPETALNSGNAQGFEWGQLPTQPNR